MISLAERLLLKVCAAPFREEITSKMWRRFKNTLYTRVSMQPIVQKVSMWYWPGIEHTKLPLCHIHDIETEFM